MVGQGLNLGLADYLRRPFVLYRIVFYSVFLTLLTVVIDIYKKELQWQHRTRQSVLTGGGSFLHIISNKNKHVMLARKYDIASLAFSKKNVVAPWTFLMKSNSGVVQPRSFIFSYVAKLDSDYGVPMMEYDKNEDESIKVLANNRLCLRSKRLSSTFWSFQNHCNNKNNHNIHVELLRCISCTDTGRWYSAVSPSGSVFGKVEHNIQVSTGSGSGMNLLQFPNYNDGPYMYQQLDIGVPIAGQDGKLKKFCSMVGIAIKQFRSGLFGAKINIRLLITRFPYIDYVPTEGKYSNDIEGIDEVEQLRLSISEMTGLFESSADEVLFVPVVPSDSDEKDSSNLQFSRAKAINALHRMTYHSEISVLAVLDVDLQVGPKFLRNALTYPFPNAAAYFPIMFSAYNPEAVYTADEFMPNIKRNKFSDHHGIWRKFSLGMYATAGSDASYLSMDENFVGWGGEDNDFFRRAGEKLNIIRLHETGLTHAWHAKNCDLGSFVEKKYFQACISSMAHLEGSQLGFYLRSLKEHDPESFRKIVAKAKVHKEIGYGDKEDRIYEESPTILIGVISSRINFGTRVKAILETWADPFNVPDGILIRFFVGMPLNDKNQSETKSRAKDIAYLAKISGMKDRSMIVVMDGVVDDEYPPVLKNTAMIENLNEIVLSFENNLDAPTTYQWIYKIDDDSYLNFDGLLSFLSTRNADGYHVYGERGIGREEDRKGLKNSGLVKPYCTGGTGYIMTRQTLAESAKMMKICVKESHYSMYRKYLWHSDTVIGICIYNATGVGCYDDADYYDNRVFRHNHHGEDPFIPTSELGRIIAAHPFKDYDSMMKQHARYINLVSTNK